MRDTEPRLSRAFAAAYGFEEGRDAAAEALAYAFEHWDRLRQVANLPGYLYRVGQSRTRRRRQPADHRPKPPDPRARAPAPDPWSAR